MLVIRQLAAPIDFHSLYLFLLWKCYTWMCEVIDVQNIKKSLFQCRAVLMFVLQAYKLI